jgi:hypothetical protein
LAAVEASTSRGATGAVRFSVTMHPLAAFDFAGKVSPTYHFPTKRFGFLGVWPGGPFGRA